MSDYQPICFSEKEVVARKEHVCCECSCQIKKGEKYVLSKGVWEDGAASYKTCLKCHKTYGILEDPPDFGYLWESLCGEFPHFAKEYLEFYKRKFSKEDYFDKIQELKDEGYRIQGEIPCLDWENNLILEKRADVSYGDKVISLVDINDVDVIRGEVLFVVKKDWDLQKENEYVQLVDQLGRTFSICSHYVKKCGSCEDCSYHAKRELSSCRALEMAMTGLHHFNFKFSCSRWKISEDWVKYELKKFDKKCEEFRAHGLFY